MHEPPLLSVLPSGAELGAHMQTMTKEALAKGGPCGAMEIFLRANAGNSAFERLKPTLRERMLGNAEFFFSTELAQFVNYVPGAAALAQVNVPVYALGGADHRDSDLAQGGYLYESARWVADGVGTDLMEVPGAHAPYLDCPQELAETLRTLLRQVS